MRDASPPRHDPREPRRGAPRGGSGRRPRGAPGRRGSGPDRAGRLPPRARARARSCARLAPRPFDRLAAEAADQKRRPARPPLRRHAAGEPLRPRGGLAGGRARPHAAHAAGGRRGGARVEREPARLPPDLYDPARSLRLGARTLKNLLAALRRGRRARGLGLQRRAPARPRSGRRGDERPVEALLASISYVETRTYVRRVLANRILYRLVGAAGRPAPRHRR